MWLQLSAFESGVSWPGEPAEQLFRGLAFSGLGGSGVLSPGESEALALALSVKTDAMLLDEAAGRKCAAPLGLVAIGTLGLLVRAKNDGQLPRGAPLLRSLLAEGRF